MTNLLGCQANGAIVKGTFVKLVGIVDGRPDCSTATDGTIGTEHIIGVATHDAADNEDLLVQPLDGTIIDYLVAGGVLTPGTNADITTSGAGKAVAAVAGKQVLATFIHNASSSGTSGATADTNLCRAMLGRFNWTADT